MLLATNSAFVKRFATLSLGMFVLFQSLYSAYILSAWALYSICTLPFRGDVVRKKLINSKDHWFHILSAGLSLYTYIHIHTYTKIIPQNYPPQPTGPTVQRRTPRSVILQPAKLTINVWSFGGSAWRKKPMEVNGPNGPNGHWPNISRILHRLGCSNGLSFSR